MNMSSRFSLFLLPLMLLLSGCVDMGTENETTIISNVKGYTFFEGEFQTFTSIAFRNGKVVDILNRDSLQVDGGNLRYIDGEGRVMLPGLIDAHAHVMGLGFQEMDANLTGSQSLDEALQRVAGFSEQYPDLEWIRGRGWNHTFWEINRFPTAEELDRVVGDRPVWLRRVDGHAGWANTAAMEQAGITADTPDPDGGRIIRDEDGNPTGVFIDGAMDLVEAELPERSDREQQLALELALEQMRAHGITSVHDAGVGADTWERYKAFADGDSLTTRIYGMISGAGSTFDRLSEEGPVESYADDLLALRSVKLYADGALGSRGAAMIEPYSDDPENRGLLFSSEEELTQMVLKTASEGYQTNIHAIGDRANRVALNAFENVRDSLGDQGLRHRIEHAQIIALEDIPRFRELDVTASMQPTHATSDMNMAEDRVGSDRIPGGYAWKTLLDQGTVLASGSDFPVEDVNPFYGLHSAVTRQDPEGNPEGGWYGEQALTREEALRSFTLDAAWAAHQEEILGSLEPGKWADFILIDRDIFEVPAGEIRDTRVLETWVAGERVFSAGQGQQERLIR